jgi:hypothetical protein
MNVPPNGAVSVVPAAVSVSPVGFVANVRLTVRGWSSRDAVDWSPLLSVAVSRSYK